MIATIVGIALSVIGCIPIVATISVGLTVRRRGKALIGFDRRCPVDVVLTLSAETPPRSGRRIVRPLTGIGQVIGAAEVSRCLGRFYLKKTIRVHLSGHITNRLDGDEVILGGPAKNEEASRVITHMSDYCSIAEFRYRDEFPNSIYIRTNSGQIFSREEFDTEISNGFAKRDLCLIIAATRNNETGHRRRIILCSGFTSYGTSAAAQYFFGQLATMPRRRLHRILSPPMRFNDWGMLVIEAEFSGPNITHISPVFACSDKRSS